MKWKTKSKFNIDDKVVFRKKWKKHMKKLEAQHDAERVEGKSLPQIAGFASRMTDFVVEGQCYIVIEACDLSATVRLDGGISSYWFDDVALKRYKEVNTNV